MEKKQTILFTATHTLVLLFVIGFWEIFKKTLAAGEINLKNPKLNLPIETVLLVLRNAEKDMFTFYTTFYKIDKDVLENIRTPTKIEIVNVVGTICIRFIRIFRVSKMLLQA